MMNFGGLLVIRLELGTETFSNIPGVMSESDSDSPNVDKQTAMRSGIKKLVHLMQRSPSILTSQERRITRKK